MVRHGVAISGGTLSDVTVVTSDPASYSPPDAEFFDPLRGAPRNRDRRPHGNLRR
jgi:hypothetical protein